MCVCVCEIFKVEIGREGNLVGGRRYRCEIDKRGGRESANKKRKMRGESERDREDLEAAMGTGKEKRKWTDEAR